MRITLRWAALLMHLLLACVPAVAQTLTWTGGGDNSSFNSAANWSPAAIPGPTHDCVIAQGTGTIQISGNTAVRSIVTNRPINATGCVSVTLTGDLTLQNAITFTVDNTFTCVGLRFRGVAQAIRGNGTLRIVSTGQSGGAIEVGDGTLLEVEPAVTLTMSASAAVTVVPISIGSGATFRNYGVVSLTNNSRRVRFFGPGRLENVGRIAVTRGVVAIETAWENSGTFDVSATGLLELGGSFSAIGTVARSGGSIALKGRYTGSELVASAQTGDLSLAGGRFEGTTFSSTGGARLLVTTFSTAVNCRVADTIWFNGGSLAIEGNLDLPSGTVLRSAGFVPSLVLLGGACSITGQGSIGESASTSVSLAARGNAVATIGPDVRLPLSGSSRTLSVDVQAGSSIVLEMDVEIGPSSKVLGSVAGTFTTRGVVRLNLGGTVEIQGTGTYVNEGIIEGLRNSTIKLLSSWRNDGSIIVSDSTLQLEGAYDSFGSIERSGGQLSIGGTHRGGPLRFSAAWGEFKFTNFVGNGSRFESEGGLPIRANGGLNLVGCELAADLVSGSCGLNFSIKSGLTLTDASIRLLNTFACPSSFTFDSGPQSITGSGEIVFDHNTAGVGTNISLFSGADVTIESGITLRIKSGQAGVTVEQGAKLTTRNPIVLEGATSALSFLGAGTYSNQSSISLSAGSLSFSSLTWSNLGQISLGAGTVFNAGGTFATLGDVRNTGGTVRVTGGASGLIEATPSTGPITLLGGTYTDVVFRASGGATLSAAASSNLTLQRCTIESDFTVYGPGALRIQEHLLLRNGARLVLQSTHTSQGLSIDCLGPIVSIEGAGEILFDTATQSVGLNTASQTTLTIGAGIIVGTAPQAVGTRSLNITVGINAALINRGTIVSRRPGTTLEILGFTGSTLTNEGRLEAADGTLLVNVPSWSSPGTLATSKGTLSMQGIYGPPGMLDRSGGLLLFAGTYLGTALNTDDLQGDFALGAITLYNTTIRAGVGKRVVLQGGAVLNACTLGGTIVHNSCDAVTVSGGLTFDNATLSFEKSPACFPSRAFSFGGPSQSVSGTAQVFLAHGRFVTSGDLTVTDGIEFIVDSGNESSNGYISSNAPGSLKLYSTCTVRSRFATLTVGGSGFSNLGQLRALAGTLDITAGTNGLGNYSIASGASLRVSGSYSIDSPLTLSSGASLSLQGSFFINAPITVSGGGSLTLDGAWINKSVVSVSDGPLTLRGTWTNAGTFQLNNVSWTIGGTYSSLGPHGGAGIRYIYTSTPPGSLLVADATTGDVSLSGASLVNTTLRARDGAVFRFSGTLSLKNCVIDANIISQSCGTVNLTDDLTLVNGATVTVASSSTSCFGDGLFCGSSAFAKPFAIRGNGRIVLERPGFDRVLKVYQGTLTIEPGIEIDMPPVPSASSTYVLINPGAKIINQGRIRFRRNSTSSIEGDLVNEGVIEIENAAMTIIGPFSNKGTLATQSATLALTGTWSNTGIFDLRNTQWSMPTIPSGGWGTVSGSGNTLTTGGLISQPVLRATEATGSIILNGVSATATRFEAAPGLSFRFNNSNGKLTNCTLAGEAVIGTCGVLSIGGRFTFENNAVLRVRNTCSSAAIVTIGAATFDGSGSILVDTTGTSGIWFSTSSNSAATIDSGVTLGLDPASSSVAAAQISLSSGSGLNIKGTISADRPGRSLSINGAGLFTLLGLASARGGTLQINSSQFANFIDSSNTLSGGRWLCDSGSITLGSRVPFILGAETEVTLRGTAASFSPLWSLDRIDGTLRLDNNYLGSNPPAGVLQVSGLLELAPNATLAIGAPITLLPSARVNIGVVSPTACGRITSTASVALAGTLTGSFLPPFVPGNADRVESVVAAPTITGGFSFACFAANPAGLGVTPQLRAGPPDNLDLVATTASGAAPTILTQPLDANAQPDAEFTVVAGPVNSAYRWQRNGVPLTDGPTAAGSAIEGSATNQLRILHAAPGDAGLYRCIVENFCGSAASTPALLTVCPGDLNADGVVDDRDFNTFALAYNLVLCSDPAMPVACPADFNRDGVANDEDFMILAVAYIAMLCPS